MHLLAIDTAHSSFRWFDINIRKCRKHFTHKCLCNFQSPDNPTPYATTMLLNGNGSSGESCAKRSDGHSSGTSSPHSDPNQSFNTQSKANLGYPSFPPPGTTHSFSFCFILRSYCIPFRLFCCLFRLNQNHTECPHKSNNQPNFSCFEQQIGLSSCHRHQNIHHHCRSQIARSHWECAMCQPALDQCDEQPHSGLAPAYRLIKSEWKQ